MKRLFLATVAVGGAAASAHGAWGFRYQFLDTNTSQWSSNAAASVATGQAVQFRVVAYVDPNTVINAVNGPGMAVAFCRLTAQEQMGNFGSVAGDTVVTSTKGAIYNGNAAYTSTSVSGTTTYFGTTMPNSFVGQLFTSGTLAQYCPSNPVTHGVPQFEWVVRQGSIRLGGLAPVRTLTFSNSVRSETLWYRDLYNPSLPGFGQDVNAASPSGAPVGKGISEFIPATDEAGTVTVTLLDVPSPGTLAGLGGLLVVAGRRRRV